MAEKQNNQKQTGPSGMKRIEKPKDVKGTFLRILSYLAAHKVRMILVCLCMVLSSICTVIGTSFLKPAINDYIVPLIGQQSPDMSGFIQLLTKMGSIFLLGAVSTYLLNRLMTDVCQETLRNIRLEMFSHMQDLPLRYFDSRSHGSVMSTYTNDTDTLREMIAMSIPQLINGTISVIAIFIMMLTLSWQLTILVILWIVIMMTIVRKISGHSSKFFIRQQQELSNANGYIEEMVEGQKVIKVFNHEPIIKKDFYTLNDSLFNAATNAMSYANVIFPIMGNLSFISYAILSVAGAVLVIYGLSDIGSIGTFLQYSRNFSQPITNMSNQVNSILTALAGAERIFALLDEPVDIDEGKVTLVDAEVDENGEIREFDERTDIWAWKIPQEDGSFRYELLRGDVRFHNVTFGYVPEKVVLDDISLYARPGEKIAFVGSTGAGKTTITNLINRFYEIRDGQITYDGIDIKDIRKDDLRRSLGIVLQDTHLFTGTVADNIRYGRLDATDDQVKWAAQLANADFFIRHLPQGYDTVLTADGANLSQGQRQLIAIARAAVADPPVLILDEATSSIDTRTESLIEMGMDHLMQNRTVFVIAHRLSTVRNANAIMVLEHGHIIERGSHEDLLEQKGRYYQLYTGMFELS